MSKSKNKYVLVDMTWWQSSSRKRGIGVFLIAYFTKYFNWSSNIPLWLFPISMSAREIADFRNVFDFGEIINSRMDADNSFLTSTGKLITSDKVSYAISGSPFERPWSLLTNIRLLNQADIPLKVVLHDLLPLEFEKNILERWTKRDQQVYRAQLELLKYTSTILVTGRNAKIQVLKHLPQYSSKITTIPFGESKDWFNVPHNIKKLPPLIGYPYAITISGGEWRKNLQGTLQLFALKFPDNWRLVVICKLGKREKVKFQFLTVWYGIANRVIWAGEVSDRRKWEYLCQAKILMSLSYGEGLNLPVLEARSVGIKSMLISDLCEIYKKPINIKIDTETFKSKG